MVLFGYISIKLCVQGLEYQRHVSVFIALQMMDYPCHEEHCAWRVGVWRTGDGSWNIGPVGILHIALKHQHGRPPVEYIVLKVQV